MIFARTYFFKCLVLFSSLCLLILPVTDADLIDVVTISQNKLVASTLAVTDASTINNSNLDYMFNVTDLRPPGMAVTSFRLRNTGKAKVRYTFISRFDDPNRLLCDTLDLSLQSDGTTIFQGKLSALNQSFDAGQHNFRDWVAIIRLSDTDPKLANQYCNFSLVVDAVSGDSTHPSKFTDQQILKNTITTGNWE